MAPKKTLVTFHVKQGNLIKLISAKFRDVSVFCKKLGISRVRFYQYTNPKVTHRIYENTHDHLLFRMATLLELENERFNEVAEWGDSAK